MTKRTTFKALAFPAYLLAAMSMFGPARAAAAVVPADAISVAQARVGAGAASAQERAAVSPDRIVDAETRPVADLTGGGVADALAHAEPKSLPDFSRARAARFGYDLVEEFVREAQGEQYQPKPAIFVSRGAAYA
jgi:hypothetical protein